MITEIFCRKIKKILGFLNNGSNFADSKSHDNWFDLVAQLVEHIPFKDGVLGSSPSQVTKKPASQVLTGFFIIQKGNQSAFSFLYLIRVGPVVPRRFLRFSS
jgi:hypothetical protein